MRTFCHKVNPPLEIRETFARYGLCSSYLVALNRAKSNPPPSTLAGREEPASSARGRLAPSRPPHGHETSRASEEPLSQVIHAIPRQRFFSVGADQKAPSAVGAADGMPPVHVIAMMLGALELDGSERVLDIPTGTGYRAALLSRLARDVVSVEEDEELATRAASTLAELGLHNVQVVRGAVLDGWPERSPYQAIVVGAGATELPHALIDQLDEGGRLVIPLGDSEAQLIERLRKRLDGLDSETIGACRLDMLPSADRPPSSFPWARGSRK